MNIHGTLVPSGTGVTLPVAAVTAGAKQLAVAVIVGSYADGTTPAIFEAAWGALNVRR